MAYASTSTEFAMLDTRTTSGAFVLPLSSDIPGRIINVKDPYGAFTRSSLTVYTQGNDFFEDGTNFKILNNAYDQTQFYAGSTTRWYITGGTEQNIFQANIGIFSTIQSFNWASLCNQPNFGFASTFNPPALGKLALLDNIFTSSTAGLVSTFIEIGNLNAQPAGMNPGGTFRWMIGCETAPSVQTSGLAFKIKKVDSFGVSNSPTFYGANISTVQDVTVWDNAYQMTHYGTIHLSSPAVLRGTSPGMLRFTFTGGDSYVQFGSTSIPRAGGNLLFTGPFGFGVEAMRLRTLVAGEPGNGIRAGINNTNPSYTLSVGGPVGISNLTNASGFSYGHVKLFPNVTGGEAMIAFHSTTSENNAWPWVIGRSGNFGATQNAGSSNFGICPISNSGVNPATVTYFTPDGLVGVGAVPWISSKLDVNGPSRGKLIISTVTGTTLLLQTNSYGIYHNLTNTAFANLTLPSLGAASSNIGWFSLLRNATGVAMSITITGTVSSTPPSPFPIASSNSATIAWDGTVFRVF